MTNEEASTVLKNSASTLKDGIKFLKEPHQNQFKEAYEMAIQALEQTQWIPCSERLPKTDNKNDINSFNVLLWVKNKTHPEREAQIYLGKLRHVDGDDGSGNFWGIETKPCEWTIWGWSYFNEPEVIAWMPLPNPYEPQESEEV